MDSVLRVEVPDDQAIMITMLHMNVTGSSRTCSKSKVILVLYETKMTANNIVWSCWSHKSPAQRNLLSGGSDFFIHFQSKKYQNVGFRLVFSAHEEMALLHKEGIGAWNCSVPWFHEFKNHFPCDLRPQCVNMEDERDCPYFSEDCGLGFVTLGKRCLFREKKPVSGTWRHAEFVCNKGGGTLVNVRTQEDYERLARYLRPLADLQEFHVIWIGLHASSSFLPIMYIRELQHSDKTIAFYRKTEKTRKVKNLCGQISLTKDYSEHFLLKLCADTRLSTILCEKRKTALSACRVKIEIRPVSNTNRSLLPLLRCPLGHFTRDFLACDLDSACWSPHVNACQAPLIPIPPSFACDNGVEHVSYSLVCDARPHCSDGSDESFCEFPPCDLLNPFHCSNRQCVPRSKVCDGQNNCYNAADEKLCSDLERDIYISPPLPAIVLLSQHGQFVIHKLTQSQLAELRPAVCPETHFQCPGNGYCMPVFLRCNGVYDCLGHEDEAHCNSYKCPGYYRCKGSVVCLHSDYVCDGIFQCPENDDEMLCDLGCPENCTCYGLALNCRKPFRVKSINTLRFLDARGSGITVNDLANNKLLIYLCLAENGLTDVGKLDFPNMRHLDLSGNLLKKIEFYDLSRMSQLETLSLSGNPLHRLFQCVNMPKGPIKFSENVSDTPMRLCEQNSTIKSLRKLDLSRIKLKVFNPSFLSLMSSLETVNLSGSGVDRLLGEGFQALTHLRTLDLRGCPITRFPRMVFRHLEELETVHSDNMKICCPANLPVDFHLNKCHAPLDKLSSCDALLKYNVYRICLSLFAFFALIGNACSFSYRVFLQRKKLLSFDVFVAHLCFSDFLMGVYLSVIGVADRLYQGTYLWEDVNWMNSAACQMAGFLCLVSSEVSALVICLITVERFLVLRFPFSTVHFYARSAQVASLCVWVVGCLIAAVPLAPGVASWQFYGQTGICIPLPVSRSHSPGYAYAFGVVIVANFLFFVVIAAGQIFIYCSIRINSMSSSDTTKRSHDVTIARRLITVATSDFLCWFPIGLVGLLAATGTPITGEVNVAMAIFVLPFNSALNPFLYTLNVVLENRRAVAKEHTKRRLTAQFQSSCNAYTKQDPLPCT